MVLSLAPPPKVTIVWQQYERDGKSISHECTLLQTARSSVPCTVQCVSNALVSATLGFGSVNFWSFKVAWRGGGGISIFVCAASNNTSPNLQSLFFI